MFGARGRGDAFDEILVTAFWLFVLGFLVVCFSLLQHKHHHHGAGAGFLAILAAYVASALFVAIVGSACGGGLYASRFALAAVFVLPTVAFIFACVEGLPGGSALVPASVVFFVLIGLESLVACVNRVGSRHPVSRAVVPDASSESVRPLSVQAPPAMISNAVTDRPYRHYSEAELLDLRRQIESSLESVKREKRDYEKRVGSGFWNNEGYRDIELKEKNIWNEISAIDRELATRRNERASAAKAPNRSSASPRNAPEGWYPDPNAQGTLRRWTGSCWTQDTLSRIHN
jgi:hypothetical protein